MFRIKAVDAILRISQKNMVDRDKSEVVRVLNGVLTDRTIRVEHVWFANSTVLDLSLFDVQWWQPVAAFPVVESGEYVVR